MTASPNRIDDGLVAELTELLPDTTARRRLIEVCTPLAHRLARRFTGRQAEYEDLAQVAVVGLIKAIDRFDRSHDGGLLPYATVVVTGELKHYLRDRAALVRLPRRLRRTVRIVEDTVEDLMQRYGRAPTIAEVAATAGLSSEAVLEAHAAVRHGTPLSLDEIGPDPEIPALGSGPALAEWMFLEEWAGIQRSLLSLDDRQRRILYLRFYAGKTQTEIAGELEMSQVHVSRLLSSALAELRAAAS